MTLLMSPAILLIHYWWFFQESCMDVRAGPQRRLSTEELKLSNCGAGEDTWESLGQHGDQTGQSYRISTLNIHWKDWCWSSNTLTTWCKVPNKWKRPWCWERLKAKGERVREDEMVRQHHQLNGHESEQAPGDTGVLQSMRSQRVKHNLVTEQQNYWYSISQDCCLLY